MVGGAEHRVPRPYGEGVGSYKGVLQYHDYREQMVSARVSWVSVLWEVCMGPESSSTAF